MRNVKYALYGQMQGRRKTAAVRQSLYKQSGFTLLEMLVCMSILSVLVLTWPRLHLWQKPSAISLQSREWTLFLTQLQMDFREAETAARSETRLQLYQQNGKIVAYTCNGKQIIRTVNGLGHEWVLQNATKATYTLTANRLSIAVADSAEEQHTGIVTRFTPLEDAG